MLEKDITAERKARHAETQEDFTPQEVLDEMFKYADEELFTNFSKTYLDTSAGTGNILCYLLKKRLNNCKNIDEGISALKTMYGIELIKENAEECRKNLYDEFINYWPDADEKYKNYVNNILNNNILAGNVWVTFR